MGSIKLLDCTLRDGGYVNDWRFGSNVIESYSSRILSSGIEFIEFGFIRECKYTKDCAVFNGSEDFTEIVKSKTPGVKYLGMIDIAKPVSLELLGTPSKSLFDGFRLMFKKWQIEEAFEYTKKLLDAGFEVYAQVVATHNYSDSEFLTLIERYNKLKISCFYVVDSFGLFDEKELIHYLDLAERNLSSEILLGYHGHNNLQQVMGNAVAICEAGYKHNLIIDGTLWGIGRGAGNLNIELFASYLNKKFNSSYDIDLMNRLIRDYISEIKEKFGWGYSLPLYNTAINRCHPNYAIYYNKKADFSIKKFTDVISTFTSEEKLRFNASHADELWNRVN